MATSSGSSPTALRWWFAVVLRRLREDGGFSREDAAHAIKGSVSGIAHIESGRSLPKPLALDALLRLYGVENQGDRFAELLKRGKKGKDWWIGFDQDEIPEGFDLFLGLESSASQIESWDALVVPGLFQTPQYADHLIRGAEPELPDIERARRVELRTARQREVLDEGTAPLVWRVLSESALRLQVGAPDRDVMREQVDHLITLAERPSVKLQVLPASAGAYTGFEGSFTILSAPPELDDYPGCVYVETLVARYYYEELEDLRKYRNALCYMRVKATKPEDTPAKLREIAKEL